MGDTPLKKLSDHPNYKITDPKEGEDAIGYALRSAAHLLSPSHIKPYSASDEIMGLLWSLQVRWNERGLE